MEPVSQFSYEKYVHRSEMASAVANFTVNHLPAFQVSKWQFYLMISHGSRL